MFFVLHCYLFTLVLALVWMAKHFHIHYYYNFGESFARRNVEKFDKVLPKKCRSTEDDILVGGGQYHCSFVIRQEVKYAASRTNQYQTPTVKDADTDEQLVVVRNYITADNLNSLFSFSPYGRTRQR